MSTNARLWCWSTGAVATLPEDIATDPGDIGDDRPQTAEHAEQDALTPKRDKWIADFLYRIQTRGVHVHYNQMRKVAPEVIPVKPKRKFKVVF